MAEGVKGTIARNSQTDFVEVPCHIEATKLGHSADSTLMHAVLSALRPGSQVRCESLSDIDPTRRFLVSGSEFFGSCMNLYNSRGPRSFFNIISNAFATYGTPVSVVFQTAPSPEKTASRLQALERLAPRSCYSTMKVVSDNCVEVSRVNLLKEQTCTNAHGLAFWGYVLSSFRASGRRGMCLKAGGKTLFGNGEVNFEALSDFSEETKGYLSWTETCNPSQPFVGGTRGHWLIEKLSSLILDSLANNVDITADGAAAKLAMSKRTLQRRLNAEGISMGQMKRTFRLYMATRGLSEQQAALADVATASNFYDVSHFSRDFKVATGMSPRAFARRFFS